MVDVFDLWLPIVLSAVFVFLASSILHMVIPLHRADYKKLPGEESVLEAMRGQNVQPGQYMFPCAASMKEMGSPEMIEKCKQGPVGVAIIMPSGPIKMGKLLVCWFIYSLVMSFCVAYVASMSLAPGNPAFRLTATVAIIAYGLSYVPDSIWKGVSWSVTMKFVFDGIVYGLLTGAAFAWCWPAAG